MAYAYVADTAARPLVEPEIRRIGISDLRVCLERGWEDFRAIPTQLVFLCIVYPIVGLVAAREAFGGSAIPLLFPLISGFALVGPIAALGIYELSRRRETSDTVSWVEAFGALRSRSIGGIVLLAVMLVAVFVVWMLAATLIYRATFGDMAVGSMSSFAHDLFTTPQGMQLIVVGNIVGFLFAAFVLTLTVVSLPLLLDRDVGPIVAIRTSVRAVMLNPWPMAIWGLIVAVLLLVGAAFLMVGLAVVLPVLGHATWHLYRRVVV